MGTPGSIALIVRYDDFFTPEPNIRPAPELRRIAQAVAMIHHRRDMPAVFGVVPAGLTDADEDRDVIDAIARAADAGSEVALHGYDHQNTLKPPDSFLGRAWARFCQQTRSEFAGLSLEEQIRRIGVGLARLRPLFSSPVTTFIPPWNAYDHNTVEACRRLGIRTLSASRAWPVPGALGTAMIPQTVRADRLEDAVEHALRRSRPAAVVCVAHTWDFCDHPKPGFIGVESWKSRLSALASDRRIVITTIDRVSESLGVRLTAARLRRHRLGAAFLRLTGQVYSRREAEARRAFYPLD